MADRKAELEKKRKKLEELKKAREQKKIEAKDKVISPVKDPSEGASEREDISQLVDRLIGGDTTQTATPATLSPQASKPSATIAKTTTTPTIATSKQRKLKLVVDQLAPVNIRPREVELYAKQTQTEVSSYEGEGTGSEDEDTEERAEPSYREVLGKTGETKEQESQPLPVVEFTAEQVERIVSSDNFVSFVDRTSRLVERALSGPSDILFDYITGNSVENGDSPSSRRVVKKKVFLDERWTQNRAVNAMDWSGHHPELLLVSYYTNPNIPHDPDGVALMWDLKFQKDSPDYVFNCQSPVMSVAFSKFHPNYVIGGTYSGQIVLWDTRSGKRTPIQRSPLSSSAHTHPVYCLDVVGSQNAHNLISVSTNGKLCSWNLDMLSQPQESLELTNKQTKPVAATCLSFPSNDVNKFIVGSEECSIYQGQRHGSKPGISLQFDGHWGPITSISSHRAAGQVDFSHLFLSSSFDWSMKLWSSKLLNEQQMTNKTGYPLCSFDNNSEYVYDVQWSPVHPSVFASADGAGKLDFWDINADTEVPIVSESVESSLVKLCWSPTGHHLAAGDLSGGVHIYEAGEGFCSPHPDEWTKLQQTLLEFQENQEMTAITP
ncbi:cytoplasmic dynein 1 intermediate chain 1-like [Halichondria panicea]|uniref:cytoplasmic dynein 1 intermediate chain 1-like n=1 Tax=Halichondria panicea TaxID=6063 RepID=UPI00312B694E